MFDADKQRGQAIDTIMKSVQEALIAKGYNPVNQIVGYVMSGDPTYITSYNDARTLIQRIERDELLDELVKRYLDGITD
nr:IreB family regulatory phosphoprotein [Pseudoramibacter sp. HA2172]